MAARLSASVQTGPGGPPSLLYNGYWEFLGVKRPGYGVGAEVKERVELYLYFPSGSS